MNSALTTSLLTSGNSIKNNALASPDGVIGGQADELFTAEFSTAMKDILAGDGKLKPLDLATLKELGIQQLTELEDLSGIQLPPQLLSDAIKLQQNQLLATDSGILEAGDSIEEISLLGHPDALTLLKSNVIDNEFSESDLLNSQTGKSFGLSKREIIEVTQQLQLKKESGVTLVSNNSDTDIDFSQYAKDFFSKDTDISKEFLTQINKPEINTTKLVEQLANMDKPISVNNPINSQSLKSYSGLEQSGAVLNRIEVPVTQPGWGEAVGNRLMMMVTGKMQSANIRLNPAELGPIEIRVSVHQDQATVHFVSNSSVVREAIEDAFPRLKEMFTQNGLSLTDANVSQQSSQQGNPSSKDENSSAMLSNEESLETADNQLKNTNEKLIDIGLVDHYV